MKEIQSMAERVATLSRFFLRSTDKCKHFLFAIKKSNALFWMDEYEEAFKKSKEYLSNSLLLFKPVDRRIVLLYGSIRLCSQYNFDLRRLGGCRNRCTMYQTLFSNQKPNTRKWKKIILALVSPAKKL